MTKKQLQERIGELEKELEHIRGAALQVLKARDKQFEAMKRFQEQIDAAQKQLFYITEIAAKFHDDNAAIGLEIVGQLADDHYMKIEGYK